MTLRFYNTLSRLKEDFNPIRAGEVRLYTCGPTVHDYAHIGNFRAYVFEDLLRRTLKYFGYKVTQVMNLTDVEDKIIRKSRERGLSLTDYTRQYTEAFFQDLEALRIERAEVYPAATAHIPEMVDLIQKLIAQGYTYEVAGSIYFRISTFPQYGRLANVKAEGLRSGLRVDTDEYDKEDVRDFALWKAWTPEDGEVYWETPLGKGRPGWHIECSAMSTKYLGTHFDLHTGGVDNIFPHHENEIAQSVCGYGAQFVNYWLHNAHLMVNGEKMSKSLNNFYTLRDLTNAGFSPRVVRYFLLSAHYRQPLNLVYDPAVGNAESFVAARGALERLDELRGKLADIEKLSAAGDLQSRNVIDLLEASEQRFQEALANDLDISGALGAMFGLVKDINRLIASGEITSADAGSVLAKLSRWDAVLGIVEPTEPRRGMISRAGFEVPDAPAEPRRGMISRAGFEVPDAPGEASDTDEARIEALIQERLAARQAKNFIRADEIRQQLEAEGIILQDTAGGVRWRRG